MKTNIHELKDYTIAQSAYLAGIIDGEGSIYIGNFSCNPRTGTPYYQTNIEVTNTSEEMIDWLMQNIGGRKSKYSAKQTPTNSRKAVFRWIATGELVTHICNKIIPYITTKKRQCEIMLIIRKTYEETGITKSRFGSRAVNPEILAIRLACFNEMRSLHCRNYSS